MKSLCTDKRGMMSTFTTWRVSKKWHQRKEFPELGKSCANETSSGIGWSKFIKKIIIKKKSKAKSQSHETSQARKKINYYGELPSKEIHYYEELHWCIFLKDYLMYLRHWAEMSLYSSNSLPGTQKHDQRGFVDKGLVLFFLGFLLVFFFSVGIFIYF